jgi:hypothetical protein
MNITLIQQNSFTTTPCLRPNFVVVDKTVNMSDNSDEYRLDPCLFDTMKSEEQNIDHGLSAISVAGDKTKVESPNQGQRLHDIQPCSFQSQDPYSHNTSEGNQLRQSNIGLGVNEVGGSYRIPDDVLKSQTKQIETALLHTTNHFYMEAELAAVKKYVDHGNFPQATEIVNAPLPINQDPTVRQRKRRRTHSPEGQAPVTKQEFSSPIVVPLHHHSAFIDPRLVLSDSQKHCDNSQQIPIGQAQGILAPGPQPISVYFNSASLPVEKPAAADIDKLISIAREYRAAEKQKSAQSSGVDTTSSAMKTRAQRRPKGRKASPTAMQRAPLSVDKDPGEKNVHIDLNQDGKPRITLRKGQFPDQPVPLSACVARPRDQQLTRTRDGQAPLGRIRVNSRRTRLPYLEIDDSMDPYELMLRAAQNQSIAEIDRDEKRARNNESARRTRERTKKALTDQKDTIEKQAQLISDLQGQVGSFQREILRLQAEIEKLRNGGRSA